MRPAIPVTIKPIPANPGNAVMRFSLSLIVLYPRFFYYVQSHFSVHSPKAFKLKKKDMAYQAPEMSKDCLAQELILATFLIRAGPNHQIHLNLLN